jgi:hypothetical protein
MDYTLYMVYRVSRPRPGTFLQITGFSLPFPALVKSVENVSGTQRGPPLLATGHVPAVAEQELTARVERPGRSAGRGGIESGLLPMTELP